MITGLLFATLFILEVHRFCRNVFSFEYLHDLPGDANDVEDGDDEGHEAQDLAQRGAGGQVLGREAVTRGALGLWTCRLCSLEKCQ